MEKQKTNFALKYGLKLTDEQSREIHRLIVISRKCWNFMVAEWRVYDGDWKEGKKVLEETGVKVEKVSNSQRYKEIRAKWKLLLKQEGNEWMNVPNTRYFDYLTQDFKAAWAKYFREVKDGTLSKKKAEFLSKYKTKKATQLAQGNLTIKWNQERFDRLCQPQFKGRTDRNRYSFDVAKGGAKIDFKKGLFWIFSKQEKPYQFIINQKRDKYFEDKINKTGRITISKFSDGKAFVSFGLEKDYVEVNKSNNNLFSIGLDFGSTDYLITNFGLKINKRNTEIKRMDVRRKKLQEKASRSYQLNKGKENWSRKNQTKLYKQIAKIERKKAQLRAHDTHIITDGLTKFFDYIYLEDLNIKGMTKASKAKVGEDGKTFIRNNKKQKAGLNRNLLNNNFFETKRQLEYKSEWRGKTFKQSDRFFASSKTCSNCGVKREGKLELSVREWTCGSCGVEHDRDVNAGINLIKNNISQAGVTTPALNSSENKNVVKGLAFLEKWENHSAINKLIKSSLNGENPIIKDRRKKQYVGAAVQFVNYLKTNKIHIEI